MLNGTNFSDWKEQVQFHLGILDLNIALHEFEKPLVPIDTSSAEEKYLYKAWEKSNRLSIMFMRMTIAKKTSRQHFQKLMMLKNSLPMW